MIYVQELTQELTGSTIESTLVQDSTSTVRLVEAGRPLSQSTRHTSTRLFFYVHHYVSAGMMRLVHCKTKSMKADGLTKPLQGSMFTEFRSYVRGIDNEDKM